MSFTLSRIKNQLLTQSAICLAVIYFYPTHPGLAIPMTGHTLLAASLGLLLSYRTNSAYARFWEARGCWTKTKSTCRNLALMVKAYSLPHSPKAARHFLKLLAAYPSALTYLCLGGAIKMADYTQQFLPANNTEEYQEHPALPAMDLCLQLHNTVHDMVMESKTARKDDLVEAAHLSEISHLVDVLMEQTSCCEKILRTPVPWTYSRHTSRFLTLWIGTLPFALIGQLNKWLTLAVVIAVSFCMLGIEEIGHLIEQPFLGDPLTGDDQIYSLVDKDGEASPLIKRGLKTQPYDIGIPVCSLAVQIRDEIERIAKMEELH
jgi:putative membrane protein